VLFSEPGADGARLLRQRLAAKRLGFLLTVFHDDTCPAPASRTPRRHACATPAWPRETQGTRSRCSTLARSRRRRPGNGCPRLAVLRTLDRAADVIAVGVTPRGDCVVTVWCPASGKRHVSSPARGAPAPPVLVAQRLPHTAPSPEAVGAPWCWAVESGD